MSSYSWNYVWSGCCHSKGFGVDAATPLDITPYCGGEGCTDSKTISLPRLPSADTSKASPCQSFSSSCYQPGHGLLGRNKCCIHPQGLPCTFNWCHNAFWGRCKKSKNPSTCTQFSRKNKGLLFFEMYREKWKSGGISKASSFKSIQNVFVLKETTCLSQ